MQLRLEHNIVQKLNIERLEYDLVDNIEEDIPFQLRHHVAYSDKNDQKFAVFFYVNFIFKQLKFDVEYHSLFITDSEINEDFRNSHFPTKNAAAIAFPFLRSFIATVTLNAGFEPIILPSINFFNEGNKDGDKNHN